MADRSPIEWTEASWNPVRGCSRVSDGCRHCYAEKIAARFSGPGQPFEGFARRRLVGSQWTGKVALIPELLDLPLRWRRPRRVFVNSMSDLFHESLPDEAIDQVFAVMALAKEHTFQVLTKRPGRMLAYMTALEMNPERLDDAAAEINGAHHTGDDWPLTNLWLGVSVEDQQRANERIPLLLQTPAAVRWISAEPLLGPLDLRRPLKIYSHSGPPCAVERDDYHALSNRAGILDWVVVGGESGPGARPCDIAWIRSIREQCRAAGVPFFGKQLGARPYDREPVQVPWPPCTGYREGSPEIGIRLRDRKGGDPAEWPEDLRVRQWPKVVAA